MIPTASTFTSAYVYHAAEAGDESEDHRHDHWNEWN